MGTEEPVKTTENDSTKDGSTEDDSTPPPPVPIEPVEPIEPTKHTSLVEGVPIEDGDDFIQAVRVPTPKFFPELPVNTDQTLEPETESQKSRKSSTTSQKSKTKMNTPSSKKNMNKFDMNMGLKDKKKPSTMRKFMNMCTGKATTATDNIEEKSKDPQ